MLIFISLFIIIVLIFYKLFYKLSKKSKFLLIPQLILSGAMAYASIEVIGGILKNSGGIENWITYLLSIIFVAMGVSSIFLLIRHLIEFIYRFKNKVIKYNNYFYLSLALFIYILIEGNFYMNSPISQNKLLDFLIVLSTAFLTSFGGVSAIKYILEKEKDETSTIKK